MVGVFGDVGLLGLAVYSLFWICTAIQLRRRRTPEADAALAGVAIFGLLGLVYDWWEQPPFTVVLAALVGLALTWVDTPSGRRGLDPASPALPRPMSGA
jgi:hypothetical protein